MSGPCDSGRLPAPSSIRDGALLCAWLSAALAGREPPDSLLDALSRLAILPPTGTSWVDIIAVARAARDAARMPAASPALVLPRPGDARGRRDVPRGAFETGVAVLLGGEGGSAHLLVPGERTWLGAERERSPVASAGAPAAGEDRAGERQPPTPSEADLALRGAVLAATTALEESATPLPRPPDAREWQALVRSWEEAPWPASSGASPDVALGIRAARILSAVDAARARPRGLTAADDARERSALEDVDRAARDAIEVAFSACHEEGPGPR
ncbi:MAG: hypothetical protein ACKOT0_01600 [bacterium]